MFRGSQQIILRQTVDHVIVIDQIIQTQLVVFHAENGRRNALVAL